MGNIFIRCVKDRRQETNSSERCTSIVFRNKRYLSNQENDRRENDLYKFRKAIKDCHIMKLFLNISSVTLDAVCKV